MSLGYLASVFLCEQINNDLHGVALTVSLLPGASKCLLKQTYVDIHPLILSSIIKKFSFQSDSSTSLFHNLVITVVLNFFKFLMSCQIWSLCYYIYHQRCHAKDCSNTFCHVSYSIKGTVIGFQHEYLVLLLLKE